MPTITPEERYHTSIGSVYMAVQNINLAAVVEGLGTCTMGAPLKSEKVDEFLEVTKLQSISRRIGTFMCGRSWISDHNPPKPPRQRDGRITWI